MQPILAAAVLLMPLPAAPPPDNPPELGLVRWQRNLESGLEESRRSGRPVLLLFQEIPGCRGCVTFGGEPLSHPLVVEAIEDFFVPVAIHNNRAGYDETIRTRYEEPAWNYPVMRFLKADGRDLLPRRAEIYRTHEVADRLIAALEAAQRPVPRFLRLAAEESASDGRARAVFAMHCFWEGEARLGTLDGVVSAKAAWLDGHEVVEVEYLADRLSFEALLGAAASAGCADRVYTTTDEQARKAIARDVSTQPLRTAPRAAFASDRTFALNHSPARFLPLTPMQAMKVNAELRRGRPFDAWLSPRQATLLARIEAALQGNAEAFEALERPAKIEALEEYARRLRRRLVSLESAAPSE